MKEILDRLESKLDGLREELVENTVQTALNTAHLAEHMRRTDILEKDHADTKSRIAPLEKHINMWSGVGKAVAILGTVIAAAATIYGLFS